MQEVFVLIEQKKQEFAQLRLFQYLQDRSIDPRQRLAWAPCLTPLAIAFGELNKYHFRKEPTNDPIQKLINKYTYEDDCHWLLFLEDLEKLGFNHVMRFTDSVKFLWSDETYKTRQICHQIALYTFQVEPIVVLAAIEAIEAAGNIAFTLTAQVTQELQRTTKKSYRYFGQYHLHVETAHTIGMSDVEKLLRKTQLTPMQKAKAFEVVEKVFELFTQAVEEMMVYAENHPIEVQFPIAA